MSKWELVEGSRAGAQAATATRIRAAQPAKALRNRRFERRKRLARAARIRVAACYVTVTVTSVEHTEEKASQTRKVCVPGVIGKLQTPSFSASPSLTPFW